VAGAKKYKYNTKYNTNTYNTKYTPPPDVSFPGLLCAVVFCWAAVVGWPRAILDLQHMLLLW
jgi:hypothetical protein